MLQCACLCTLRGVLCVRYVGLLWVVLCCLWAVFWCACIACWGLCPPLPLLLHGQHSIKQHGAHAMHWGEVSAKFAPTQNTGAPYVLLHTPSANFAPTKRTHKTQGARYALRDAQVQTLHLA